MRRIALALSLTLAATSGLAQPRPFTPAMTCGQVRGLLAARGAVVLNTSQTTYDRFVSSRTFCMFNEDVFPVWVPTRDTPQCPIYRCKEIEWDNW